MREENGAQQSVAGDVRTVPRAASNRTQALGVIVIEPLRDELYLVSWQACTTRERAFAGRLAEVLR